VVSLERGLLSLVSTTEAWTRRGRLPSLSIAQKSSLLQHTTNVSVALTKPIAQRQQPRSSASLNRLWNGALLTLWDCQ
jgi:hypothetical protein